MMHPDGLVFWRPTNYGATPAAGSGRGPGVAVVTPEANFQQAEHTHVTGRLQVVKNLNHSR